MENKEEIIFALNEARTALVCCTMIDKSRVSSDALEVVENMLNKLKDEN